jgi:hypothetical protein
MLRRAILQSLAIIDGIVCIIESLGSFKAVFVSLIIEIQGVLLQMQSQSRIDLKGYITIFRNGSPLPVLVPASRSLNSSLKQTMPLLLAALD